MMKRVDWVIATILTVVGFFLLFGTAGTIDRLPTEQLPTGQMILQVALGTALHCGGGIWLNHIYGDNNV